MNISFLVFSLAPFNFASFSCDRLRAHLESTRVEYLEIYLKLTAAVVVAIVVVATLVAVDVVVVSIFLRPVTRINFVMELFARLLYERMQQAGLDECGDSPPFTPSPVKVLTPLLLLLLLLVLLHKVPLLFFSCLRCYC